MIKANRNLIERAMQKPDTFIYGKNRMAHFDSKKRILFCRLYGMLCYHNVEKNRVAIVYPWDTATTRNFLNDCLPVTASIKKGYLTVKPAFNDLEVMKTCIINHALQFIND